MDLKKSPDLGPAGSEWWTEVTQQFEEITPAEAVLIAEIAHTLDTIDRIRKDVAETGVIVVGSKGQPRAHPGIAAIAATQRILASLLRQLDLPDDDEDDRPPARRRVHPATSNRARKAAESRWRRTA